MTLFIENYRILLRSNLQAAKEIFQLKQPVDMDREDDVRILKFKIIIKIRKILRFIRRAVLNSLRFCRFV